MSSFVLTPHAKRDLLAIEEHTLESFGLEQALSLADQFAKAMRMLSEQPRAGHIREDLTPGGRMLRYWLVSKRFLIVYRPDTTPIQIIRVIDGYRDIRHILEDGA